MVKTALCTAVLAFLVVLHCADGYQCFALRSYAFKRIPSLAVKRANENAFLSVNSVSDQLINLERNCFRRKFFRSKGPRALFKFQRKAVVLSSFLVCCTHIRAANAVSVPFRSLQQADFSLATLKRVLFLVVATAGLIDVVQTRRRQSNDATSEWGRYARHPHARGRAITSLVVLKLFPLWFVSRFLQFLSPTSVDRLQTYMGKVFAGTLLKLGPLYIKMGQIVSCRDNLLPKQWSVAMERLQDQVPAQSGEKARELAYATWPGGQTEFDSVFSDVQWTPLAAASLGQVHTAVLASNGDRVAMKLQRPYLREIYDNDFALLTKIASVVDRFFGSTAGAVGGVSQSWTEIFQEAEGILYREINYRAEADNAIRFSRDFGLAKGGEVAPVSAKSYTGEPLSSAASWLRTPYIYSDLSTETVLVMEYVYSIKVTSSTQLDEATVTAADRVHLADCLGRSYIRQFCCNKFFSTDPHAGNLGIELLNMNSTSPAERVRLVYYDFGQAAELQQNQADGILDLVEAIVDLDVDRSVESFHKMGILKEGADLSAVREKVSNNFRTGKIKYNRSKLKKNGYKFQAKSMEADSIEPSSAVNATSDQNVMQYFTMPTEYAFVGRALSQLDGVGKSLDPEFNFISCSAPWIYEIKGKGKYLQEEAAKRFKVLRDAILKKVTP